MTINNLDRRTVLRGAAVVAVGAGLAACGDDSAAVGTSSSAAPTTTATAIGSFSEAPSAPVASSEATDGASALNAIGLSADVPVGSGVIFEDAKVVVTQPTEGAFKAFTAVCTHQGCLVSKVEKTQILCNCHGSVFSIADGSVISGPAPTPLAEEKLTVTDGSLTLG